MCICIFKVLFFSHLFPFSLISFLFCLHTVALLMSIFPISPPPPSSSPILSSQPSSNSDSQNLPFLQKRFFELAYYTYLQPPSSIDQGDQQKTHLTDRSQSTPLSSTTHPSSTFDVCIIHSISYMCLLMYNIVY